MSFSVTTNLRNSSANNFLPILPRAIRTVRIADIAQQYMDRFSERSERFLARFDEPALIPVVARCIDVIPAPALSCLERSVSLSRSIWEALYDCSEDETSALEEVLKAELEPCFDEEATTAVDFSEFWVEWEPEEVELFEYAFETESEDESDGEMSTLPEELRKARMDPEFHPQTLQLMIEIEQAMIHHPNKDKLLQMPFPAFSGREVDEECLEYLQSLAKHFRKLTTLVNRQK